MGESAIESAAVTVKPPLLSRTPARTLTERGVDAVAHQGYVQVSCGVDCTRSCRRMDVVGTVGMKTRLLALLIYGFSVVMPLAHSVLELGAPERGCTNEPSGGAVLSAPCENPCTDPTHHHRHTSHDPAHCLICQLNAEPRLMQSAFCIILAPVDTEAFVRCPQRISPNTRRLRANPSRGPPA